MRAIADRHCGVCGKGKVQLWTLDNLTRAGAIYLCKEHGKPLQDILDLAGDIPPEPLAPPEPVIKTPREPKLVPLLDWTPPA